MGKLPPNELEQVLRYVKWSSSVVVPPGVGLDSGVHRVRGGLCAVVSTDPCLAVPTPWFGWLLIHYAASDVAVFGVQPRYCAVNLLAPRGTKKHVFQRVTRDAQEAASELGMSIVTGHTGRYEALRELVGACTAYGFAPCAQIKTPADAAHGDRILCTKPVGMESLATFSRMRPSLANEVLGEERSRKYARLFKFQSCVREALLLSRMPAVHGLHDVAEGGLVAAVDEMSRAAGLGFTIHFDKILFCSGIQDLARRFRLSWKELMSMSSTGSLVVAVRPESERAVIDQLEALRIPVSVVGGFSRRNRRIVHGPFGLRAFPAEAKDPFHLICQ